ncbi:MAG: GNAT family N-acetyltransferase [Calditrichaeota bacterium]|nr:GNAT family N-acetyltransferase [Calditrichota bacterium]
MCLRNVEDGDLPIFFEHQRDPESLAMAAFKSRERTAFFDHWAKIRRNKIGLLKTIVYEGEVAGNIASFMMDGHREVGYWIGRTFWGKGIASKALGLFIAEETERPLYAGVAEHNAASVRVLQKCGFEVVEKLPDFADVEGKKVGGWILRLA